MQLLSLSSFMEDEEIIKFSNTGSYYPFFQMVLVLTNVSFFDDAFHPEIKGEMPGGFDLKAHNEIIDKFTKTKYYKIDQMSLTFSQLLYLMTATDKLCKLLLSDEAELLKIKMSQQIPDLLDNWDKDFLSASQIMFHKLKVTFENYPGYEHMLKKATAG